MDKSEIALQLTLKSIEKMVQPRNFETDGKSDEHNSQFAKQVCDFYNYLYNNLDNTITI